MSNKLQWDRKSKEDMDRRHSSSESEGNYAVRFSTYSGCSMASDPPSRRANSKASKSSLDGTNRLAALKKDKTIRKPSIVRFATVNGPIKPDGMSFSKSKLKSFSSANQPLHKRKTLHPEIGQYAQAQETQTKLGKSSRQTVSGKTDRGKRADSPKNGDKHSPITARSNRLQLLSNSLLKAIEKNDMNEIAKIASEIYGESFTK